MGFFLFCNPPPTTTVYDWRAGRVFSFHPYRGSPQPRPPKKQIFFRTEEGEVWLYYPSLPSPTGREARSIPLLPRPAQIGAGGASTQLTEPLFLGVQTDTISPPPTRPPPSVTSSHATLKPPPRANRAPPPSLLPSAPPLAPPANPLSLANDQTPELSHPASPSHPVSTPRAPNDLPHP